MADVRESWRVPRRESGRCATSRRCRRPSPRWRQMISLNPVGSVHSTAMNPGLTRLITSAVANGSSVSTHADILPSALSTRTVPSSLKRSRMSLAILSRISARLPPVSRWRITATAKKRRSSTGHPGREIHHRVRHRDAIVDLVEGHAELARRSGPEARRRPSGAPAGTRARRAAPVAIRSTASGSWASSLLQALAPRP